MESFHVRVRGTDEDRARLVLAAARRRVRVPDLVREALDSVLANDSDMSDSFFDDGAACEQRRRSEVSDE